MSEQKTMTKEERAVVRAILDIVPRRPHAPDTLVRYLRKALDTIDALEADLADQRDIATTAEQSSVHGDWLRALRAILGMGGQDDE